MGYRADGPHATRIGPLIAIPDALVIHRRGQQPPSVSVRHCEHGHLHALEEFLDDDLLSRSPESLTLDHLTDGSFGLPQVFRHDDALAGGEPARLDDIGRLHRLEERQGIAHLSLAEDAVFGGGNAVLVHEFLGELLAALQCGSRLGRADDGNLGQPLIRSEKINDPLHQRGFRPHDQHVDSVFEDTGGHCIKVHGVQRHVGAQFLRSRIARGKEGGIKQGAARDLQADGVFASTGTKYEYTHGTSKLPSLPCVPSHCFQHRGTSAHQTAHNTGPLGTDHRTSEPHDR